MRESGGRIGTEDFERKIWEVNIRKRSRMGLVSGRGGGFPREEMNCRQW